MTHATDPIEFVGLTSPIQERFTETSATTLSPELIAQLAAICSVSTEDQDLADHGRDWWPLAMHWAMQGKTPRKPHAVCRPVTTEQVVAIVTMCNENRIPLTVSAGRSGVCGAAIPVYGGVVLDTCLLASIVSVDKVSGVVEVLPGMFGPDFENELRDTHGVTVGHFPSRSTSRPWADGLRVEALVSFQRATEKSKTWLLVSKLCSPTARLFTPAPNQQAPTVQI